MTREPAHTLSNVRLRDRAVAHQLAVWWGLLGAVATVILFLRPLPFDNPIATAQALVMAVTAGVPAIGAWLAAHASTRRAQAGLGVLATWGLLAVGMLLALLFASSIPFSLRALLFLSHLAVIPVVGLVLAGWALTRGTGLPWRGPSEALHGLAGLGVAVYGLGALLPDPAIAYGPPPGGAGGLWDGLLAGSPWDLAARLISLLIVVALGVAVARLAAPFALAPAAVVAVSALEDVADTLLHLAVSRGLGGRALEAATTHPLLAIQVALAVAALAATTSLAIRARRRTSPPT